MMRRWEFIALLGSAAVTWPSHSYSQTPNKVHRAAVISPTASAIESFRNMVGEFRHGDRERYQDVVGNDDEIVQSSK